MHAQTQVSINIRSSPNCRSYLSLKYTCKFTVHIVERNDLTLILAAPYWLMNDDAPCTLRHF